MSPSDPGDNATTPKGSEQTRSQAEVQSMAASAKARERSLELAKYFSALSITPTDPNTPCDLSGDPRSAPDNTLTALAQLGTFRLRCDRSFISLIDRTHQYIIGEATRETSLLLPGSSNPCDGLCLGIRALDLSFGICPATIGLFSDDDTAIDTANISADRTHYIVRDFRADARFADRPYVTDWPHMRAYAEVPLRGNGDLVLGSYCVIDDKPRDFNDVDIGILSQLAVTITNHLNLLKSKEEFGRIKGLVRSIGSYAAGYSDAEAARGSLGMRRTLSSTTESFTDASSDYFQSTTLSATERKKVTQAAPDRPSVLDVLSQEPTTVVDTSNRSGKSVKKDLSLTDKIDTTFSRAASLIQTCMKMQGLVIFDLSAAGFTKTERTRSPSTMSTVSDLSALSSSQVPQNVNILGLSMVATDDPTDQATTVESLDIRGALLQRMLARHPLGHIFSYDETGVISGTRLGRGIQNKQHPSHHIHDYSQIVVGSTEEEDATELFQAIKDVRSIIFLPIWDHEKDRWFGTILGWTTDRTRILETDDLNYLSAFGNSMMAEVSRLKATGLSQAKSDFISSISHELRSPLHGILAGTELLRESALSTRELSLLGTIDACGNMLLDTLENLLDYAKINNLANKHNNLPNGAAEQVVDQNLSKLSVVDLGVLIQDVVEGVYLGHSSRRPMRDETAQAHTTGSRSRPQMDADEENTMKQEDHNDVAVLIDIDPSVNWAFETEVGMWKRIVMNLFVNSLKYTSRGTIRVSLRLVQPLGRTVDGADTPKHISLQVNDTGSGISKEYLENRLFTPYAQENDLSVGTGLGLSIVRQLVESLKGSIDVQSDMGIGTTIGVTIPLSGIIRSQPRPRTEAKQLDPDGRLKGQVLCLPTLRSSDTMSAQDFKSGQNVAVQHLFANIAEKWLGMTVLTLTRPEGVNISADVEYFSLLHGQGPKALEWSLYMPTREAGSLPTSEMGNVGQPAGAIRPPFGPRTLAVALLFALERKGRPLKSATGGGKGSIARLNSSIEARDSEGSVRAIQRLPDRPITLQPATEQENAMSRPSAHDRPMNLLLVDDNEVNLRLLSSCVQKAGYDYHVATNGLEALELYKSNELGFDVIFMDLSMPVMDGFTASREIRSFENQNGIERTKIIALTALANEEKKSEAYANGIDLFFSKPVKMRDVKELIGKAKDERDGTND